MVFTDRGAYGPFPTRREAIEWGCEYGRAHDLRGSFWTHKLYAPIAHPDV